MAKPTKIDEWIQEAEQRPESALLILRLIAGRLKELTERNEELLAENIALQDGSRVEEYKKRIAHLEYQLEMLKRRVDPDGGLLPETAGLSPATCSLLLYHPHGRIVRLEPDASGPSAGGRLGRITPEPVSVEELPRLLVVPSDEEVLLLFSSGRIGTCPVSDLPVLPSGADWTWEQAALPDEPHAGEQLACLMPLANLPLADFFLQTSRRGCVKKTMTSMAETVLSNHFLGRGANQKSDQAFDVSLCRKNSRHALVTYEGRLIGLEVDQLSFATEERIRLEPHDHVVASFAIAAEQTLFCLTQNGKAILRPAGSVEAAKTGATRGQALISPARIDQGVRFIGAAAIREGERLAVLDAQGNLTIHPADEMVRSGALPGEGTCLAFAVLPAAPGTAEAA
jgi:DNA gyrase/topoisomerase IV subunit A